jgi:hypothetical protein
MAGGGAIMYAFDAATNNATSAPLEWKLEVAPVRETAKARITESVEEVCVTRVYL